MLLALLLLLGAADELRDNLVGEWTFGVSNTNAVAGHGRLTAAFAEDGELTVLAWPGPSGPSQVQYIGMNGEDARSLPHMGAQDGMGARIGLVVDGQLAWLRDFPHAQAYSQPDAPVPVTTYTLPGLTVTVTDVVLPDRDVLSRNVKVVRSGAQSVQIAVYENLSPTLSEIPQLPIADWALPARNDFVAAWDADAQAVLHFHPGDRAVAKTLDDVLNPAADPDYGPADALMQSASPISAPFIAQLDAAYPAGVAAYVTTEPAPAQFQVGSDATPYCDQVAQMIANIEALPSRHPGLELPWTSSAELLRCADPLPGLRQRRGWTWMPRDALADLQSGTLSGSQFAAGQTNSALISAPLAFEGDTATGAVLFALGPTRAAALDALKGAEIESAGARQAAAEQAAHEALAGAALPDPALGDAVRAVALRALVNIYVAREASTGAIVASISRQPPYHLDWPRDGAFLDAALDVAGLHGWVTQRLAWYEGLARAAPTQGNPLLTPSVPIDPATGTQQFPAGVWEMNYFGDGAAGGPIRFEIDNTALHLWSISAHAAYADTAALWPSTKAAAQVLAGWRAKTGLPAPANEDDHADLTSTLHGAVATYAGLVAAERLARKQRDAIEGTLRSRAEELRTAILANYYDPATGLFRATRDTPGAAIGGPAAWLVWPGRLLDPADARVERQLGAEIAKVLSALRGETAGAGYVGKVVVAAALYGKTSRDGAREAVQRLAAMATPGTDHFGEIFLTQTGAGGPTFVQAVSPPHVWEGGLFYLSAMALSQPKLFNAEETALPLGTAGCASAAGGLLAALAAVLYAISRASTPSALRRKR